MCWTSVSNKNVLKTKSSFRKYLTFIGFASKLLWGYIQVTSHIQDTFSKYDTKTFSKCVEPMSLSIIQKCFEIKMFIWKIFDIHRSCFKVTLGLHSVYIEVTFKLHSTYIQFTWRLKFKCLLTCLGEIPQIIQH